MIIELRTDGGARGNPGPSAAGIVITSPEKEWRVGVYLGVKTNNQAEYLALLKGLEIILNEIVSQVEVAEISVKMDSELIIKQINGEYRVRDAELRTLYEEIQRMREQLPMIQFSHIPRKENALADSLVNQVLDLQNGT